jgi:broad specificity phosphatase PhoE
VAKYVDMRRHTDNDGDRLTDDGIAAAMAIGSKLRGDYDVLVSSGAQRATQTLACLIAPGTARASGGVVVDDRFKSENEDRWKEAYERAGSGDIESFKRADPDLVAKESGLFARALQDVFDRLPEGGRAMVVGHSPMQEAAVWGLTGEAVGPLGKGEGVLVVRDDDGSYRVESPG